jgi:hypothetical protein
VRKRETLPFVPEQAISDALAGLETISSQDRLLRRLISPELEPLVLLGKG